MMKELPPHVEVKPTLYEHIKHLFGVHSFYVFIETDLENISEMKYRFYGKFICAVCDKLVCNPYNEKWGVR